MRIAGMGWVTPLGCGVEAVWERLLAGEVAPVTPLANEQNGHRYLVRRVPPERAPVLPLHPRLRRASPISRFAAAAGLAAIAEAGTSVKPERTALIFAISNGAVIYTRRFYAEIVKSGAQAASPLLFPETVFNAPASHLAAILGITGATYTVVGDGAVGVLALKLGQDLIAAGTVNACLVVAAEEIDPLVCEAYRQWRFLRNPSKPEAERGMIVGEGAGAVLLEGNGNGIAIEQIDPGANFFRRSEAAMKLRIVFQRLGNGADLCVCSANGTFIDQAERVALGDLPQYSPKDALGDSVGASVLWQLIAAAQALRTGRLPTLNQRICARRALVLACGLNQQLGGLAVSLR